MKPPMQVRVIKAGPLASVQDLGRWAFLDQGVPVSGVMDTLSARIANLVLGNPADAAVIEFTYSGAVLMAETDLFIAYAGAGSVLMAGTTCLPSDRPLFIPAGVQLTMVAQPVGCRIYLAVAGGWTVPDVLGSKSTYLRANFGGHFGRSLQGGDTLTGGEPLPVIAAKLYNQFMGNVIRYPKWGAAQPRWLSRDRYIIQVVPAQEITWFEGRSVVDLLSAPFTVSPNSDRMGYRLEGPPIRRSVIRELLSTAVTAGTVQVTGEGTLILLMADCQTTGGYPRIAQVAAVDIPLCAQLKPGDKVCFREISRMDAEKQYLHQEKQLEKLAVSVSVNHYRIESDDNN